MTKVFTDEYFLPTKFSTDEISTDKVCISCVENALDITDYEISNLTDTHNYSYHHLQVKFVRIVNFVYLSHREKQLSVSSLNSVN